MRADRKSPCDGVTVEVTEWEGTGGGVMPWEPGRWQSGLTEHMICATRNWGNSPGPHFLTHTTLGKSLTSLCLDFVRCNGDKNNIILLLRFKRCLFHVAS